MVVVDPDFVRLMRRLRQENGMSFRDLAEKAHFSLSYLCEVENGKKPPSLHLAKALDACLNAEGQLTRLVTNGPDDQEPESRSRSAATVDCPDRSVEAWRTQPTWSTQMGGPALVNESQWAQVATMLYDIFVRSRPPLTRLGPDRYTGLSLRRQDLTPFAAEATIQERAPRVECRAVSRQQAPRALAAGARRTF